MTGGKVKYMYRKEDLIVNYFCPRTTADSQIADIPFMEGETKESFQNDLNDWLHNFAEDYWENDPNADSNDEIYVEERTEDDEFIILASIKKNAFENYENPSPEEEPFDSDREPDVDFNGGLEWY